MKKSVCGLTAIFCLVFANGFSQLTFSPVRDAIDSMKARGIDTIVYYSPSAHLPVITSDTSISFSINYVYWQKEGKTFVRKIYDCQDFIHSNYYQITSKSISIDSRAFHFSKLHYTELLGERIYPFIYSVTENAPYDIYRGSHTPYDYIGFVTKDRWQGQAIEYDALSLEESSNGLKNLNYVHNQSTKLKSLRELFEAEIKDLESRKVFAMETKAGHR